MNSIIAFTIIAAIILGSLSFGVFGARRIEMTPQELVVGNRSFATILIILGRPLPARWEASSGKVPAGQE
jgi:hypothetical protein